MSKIQLDQEEQEILDVFDADEFESVITDDRRSDLVQAAEETFKKGKLRGQRFFAHLFRQIPRGQTIKPLHG